MDHAPRARDSLMLGVRAVIVDFSVQPVENCTESTITPSLAPANPGPQFFNIHVSPSDLIGPADQQPLMSRSFSGPAITPAS